MTKMIRFAAAALVLMTSAALAAQEKPAPAASQDRPASVSQRTPVPQVPLKVQLVLSRYQGEKKISSVPYVLWVTANDGTTTNLRMGVQMPIPSGNGSFNYRDVGTNIDCTATSAEGNFKIQFIVSDSSVFFGEKTLTQAGVPPATAGQPAFRSFTSKFNILLRDGQTAQYTAATDQVSGEVMKIDATLTVLK